MPRLAEVVDFLHRRIAPNAAQLDVSLDAMAAALDAMAEAGYLGLRCPAEYGNEPLTEAEHRQFQQACARASGAFAFLQTQHQSAVSMLAKSDNDALRDSVLPRTIFGEHRIGIGFSQLRRPGEPIMRATADADGYRLSGHVPWITGYGFFGEFLIGAELEDGRAVFGLVPLRTAAGIRVSAPMPLAAMQTANTVTADLTDFRLPAEHVAFIRPPGWIRENDRINVALQGHFAVGCGAAALDLLNVALAKRDQPENEAWVATLRSRWRQAKDRLEAVSDWDVPAGATDRLDARAEAIVVMQDLAWAAVTMSAGAANSLSHPAQRILREALVFTVSAQTAAIQTATLGRIATPGQIATPGRLAESGPLAASEKSEVPA
ncbi:MAG: acyl-CoA dehydrogenase family protein [Fimbriimonadaceae bacterium]|nr:acyl-CoA dehydrogenase family protein [Fimbriimonadaceae bacterium]